VPSVNINESTGRIQYTATSGQTVFVYDFVIFTEADLVVIQEGTTLTYLTDYTITGVGNGTGGTVTLLVGTTVGDTVTIYRDTTIARSSQYNPDGRFDAAPLERDFDKITTILQELKRDSNRTVKLAADDPLDSLTLPTDRENKFLSFDANGSPIATVGSTSVGTPFGATGISLAAADTKATALSVLGILADNQTFAGDLILNGSASFKGKTLFQDDGSRTISSGSITALGSYHTIDTQSAAASDDLDTISTTGSGLFVMWRAEDDARTVVVKHNTGNIFIPTALDISLDTTNRVIGTLYDSDLAKHIVLFDGTTKEYVVSLVTTAKVYSGTAVASTSGSSISFTGIPAGVKKITLNLVGVSTNGTANLIAQIGDSGGLENSGYLGATGFVAVTTPQSTNHTNGVNLPAAAASTFHGSIEFELVNAATFTWVARINVSTSDAAIVAFVSVNDTIVAAAKAALFIVIRPVGLLSVTAVALLVACVTVPPAPVV